MAIIKTSRFSLTEQASLEDLMKRYPNTAVSASKRLATIFTERELLMAAPPTSPLSGYVVEFREKPIAYATSQADALKAMREFVGWWRAVSGNTAPSETQHNAHGQKQQITQTWDLRYKNSRHYYGTVRAKAL